MARNYTIGELKQRARRYADMENTNFIQDDEVLDYLNAGYAELYDILVVGNEDYFTATADITLANGITEYALPDDFYKMTSVSYVISANQFLTLKPYMEQERNSYGTVTNVMSGQVHLRYVPEPIIYTSDDQNVDGISGWEEYIAVYAAIRMLDKEETDSRHLVRERDRLAQRIETASQNRDQGMPARVVDLYQINPYNYYRALRYRIVGSYTISVLSTDFVSPFWY